jgi:hypothetical protein
LRKPMYSFTTYIENRERIYFFSVVSIPPHKTPKVTFRCPRRYGVTAR